MKKIILPLFMLISMLFLNSCSFVHLKPSGEIVISVITTKETDEWEKKDDLDKKYYDVYSNGVYQETDRFKPDDVTKYYVDYDNMDGNKVVNPTVWDNNDNLINPDEKIRGIINAAAKTIENPIWKFEIMKDKDKYFAFIWLNVNWSSPCELYEYDMDNHSIHQLCEWEEVDIVGISVPTGRFERGRW